MMRRQRVVATRSEVPKKRQTGHTRLSQSNYPREGLDSIKRDAHTPTVHRHSRLRLPVFSTLGTTLLLIASVLVTEPSAALAAAPTSPISGIAITSGPACPDVMVIGARGTGETPKGVPAESWTGYLGDPDLGVGSAIHDFYGQVGRPGLHTSLDAVVYPALSVSKLTTPSGYRAYVKGVQTGAAALISDIEIINGFCRSGVHYVLASYSSGAWVVHQAMWQLAETDPALARSVSGVALFRDSEFMPGLAINQGNQAALSSTGVAQTSAAVLAGYGFSSLSPDRYSSLHCKRASQFYRLPRATTFSVIVFALTSLTAVVSASPARADAANRTR